MIPCARPTDVVVGCLAGAAAGAVDVIVFTGLGHVFASVITGNLVVVGVGIGSADGAAMWKAAVSVLAYAVGVVAATIATRRFTPSSPRRLIGLYLAELLLLGILAALWVAGDGRPHGAPAVVALVAAAAAMGVQTRAFTLAGVPGVSSTYFTGTLTGLLTSVVVDGTLNRAALVALLALLAGATASGALVTSVPVAAVALPIALVAVAALVVAMTSRPRAQSSPRS